MTSTELLMEGVDLMFLGLGAVFVFLLMLVGCINLMSRLVARFLPEELAVAAPVRKSPVAAAPGIDQETLAVISAAVRQHRARRAG